MTPVQGITDFPTEARAVAKAARDVGVNVSCWPYIAATSIRSSTFRIEALLAQLSPVACACVTRRFVKPPPPAAEQVAMVVVVAADIEGPGDTIQYGPAGVQVVHRRERCGGSAEVSARTGRCVHMHLLETRYQRNWADRTYRQGIVRDLDEIGPPTSGSRWPIASGCGRTRWSSSPRAAPPSWPIPARTSSSAPASRRWVQFLRRGCRVAMGLDGLSFDEDEDALREMRLAYVVHKAAGFDIRMRREDLLRIAFENGRFALTGASVGGRVAPGAPADPPVLDWDKLAAELVEPEVPPLELMLAKARQEHIKQVFVAGREIVHDGALTGIDLPALEAELLAALRKAAAITADVRRRHAGNCVRHWPRIIPVRSIARKARTSPRSRDHASMTQRAIVHRISASAPDDASGIEAAIASGASIPRGRRGSRQDRRQWSGQRLFARSCALALTSFQRHLPAAEAKQICP